MTDNIHGPYADAIAHLKDVADGGKAKRAAEQDAVNQLLALSKQGPKQDPETSNPLVNEVLKQVRR